MSNVIVVVVSLVKKTPNLDGDWGRIPPEPFNKKPLNPVQVRKTKIDDCKRKNCQ